MDPERWQRIGDLFHDALACGAGERARFLDDACRDDPALRAEVESLLAHHDDSSDAVVLTPADRGAVDPDDAGAQAALVGRQFGQYQVTRKLGEGGMPENVIRTQDAGIKILDFGLARFSDVEMGAAASATRLTEPGSALGTPGYMSPEQIRGQEVDFRSDMFAFGVLLFELTSGLHPFSGGGQASTVARVLEADPPELTELVPACSPDLERIILRCLQKAADRRYGATRELLDELEQVRRDQADRSVRPAAGGRGRDRARTTHRPDPGPVWWWQFHQRVTGLVYYAMLYPLWNVRQWAPPPWGTAVFFAALAAVLVAGTLRFHLSFTQRFNPAQLDTQQAHVATWIRAADWLLVILLVASAALISSDHAAWASVVAAVGIISCLAFLIIEPATTRAAFQRGSDGAG